MSRQLISPLRPSSPTGEFLSRQIWLRTVLLAAIVCLGGPLVGAAWAQETTVGLALVAGRVLDAESEKPIDGAEVLLVGDATEISRETDNSGAFMFPRVPRGAYQLVVEHLAYGTRSETIEIVGSERIDLQLRLTMEPIELEPLVVAIRRRYLSPRMLEFYERVDHGLGYFITRADIENRMPGRITHMIADAPGVQLVQAGESSLSRRLHFRRHVRWEAGQTVPCWPTVYLDGGRVQDGGPEIAGRPLSEMDIDDLVLPADVEGVEVYDGAGGLPPRFGGSFGGCGVIAVWTRIAI
jgi:hypothetical protein